MNATSSPHFRNKDFSFGFSGRVQKNVQPDERNSYEDQIARSERCHRINRDASSCRFLDRSRRALRTVPSRRNETHRHQDRDRRRQGLQGPDRGGKGTGRRLQELADSRFGQSYHASWRIAAAGADSPWATPSAECRRPRQSTVSQRRSSPRWRGSRSSTRATNKSNDTRGAGCGRRSRHSRKT